ncbi:MAG: TonB-dependent receptor [Ignavibacteria bacterium]|nr:TonB-dependent receptor [Ignavibacteria bacterium]
MRKLELLIWMLFLVGLTSTFAVANIHLIFQVEDFDGKPLPNCRIVISEPTKVAFTNKFGKATFNIPYKEHIKASFEKNFFHNLDTLLTLPKGVDTLLVEINLREKEFHSREVVVTATRTEKELLSLSLPMSTFTRNEIKLVNAKKLDELLLELTDIPLVDDHGRGIQLQGLDPDYTLLLVNGEPMVNRTGGILDISRLSIGNVSRIEIVKGPNSSIYGSNALAGVVNIITEAPENQTEINLYTKYGSFNSSDIIGEYKQQLFNEVLSFSIFGHRYKTDGYSLVKNSVGKTVPEILNQTLHLETFINVTQRSKIRFSVKSSFEDEFNNYLANKDTINSKNKVKDISSYLFYKNTVNEKFNYEFRTYYSFFDTKTNDSFKNKDSLYDQYHFSQNIFKSEFQSNILFGSNQYLTLGIGYLREEAKSARIGTGREKINQFYFYAQDDFTLFDKLNIIGSFRIDDHSQYEIQFTPKVSASFQINPKFYLRASVGTGFKAPNFEEMYLNWTNPMAGYSVFGRTYVLDGLKKLQSEGQIATLLISPDTLPFLQPEKSLSFDFGGNFVFKELFVKINVFRNNVSNLIDFLPVALKTNGQRLHTYQNLNRIFTQGIELSLEYKFFEPIILNFSYQFLMTGDLDVIDKIRQRKIFKRDISGFDVPVKLSDYGGLFHRPTHSGNIRITFYEKNFKLFSSLRINFKSKYGYKDINGNMILDDEREYAPGYAIVNWNVTKEFFELFAFSLGINNLFNKKDVRFLASNPGITFYLSINFNYVKH